MRRSFFAFALAALLISEQAFATELKVQIFGLRSDHGDVHIAIYDTPDKFPKGDGMLAEQKVLAVDRKAVAVFRDLPPNIYAVATFHDENDNNHFDRNLVGLPLEGYAFSNGATVFLGPPSFEDAAITVTRGGRTIDIEMGY